MMKRKVIEDSDDEGNAEATPPRPAATGLSDITLSTLVSLDDPRSQEILEQTADPSTSSTELLNRESHAAHRSLIEPTPKSPPSAMTTHTFSQKQTPTSPTISLPKTKRSKTSVERPKTKRPLKTYGKSSQDIFEFHGGSDGEIDVLPRIDLSSKAGKRKKSERAKVDRAASRQGSQSEDVANLPITSSGGYTESLTIESKANEASSAPEKEVSLQGSMLPPTFKSTSFSQSQQSQIDKMHTMVGPESLESTTNKHLPPAGKSFSDTHADDRSLLQSVTSETKHSNEAMERNEPRQIQDPAPSSSASELIQSEVITVKRTDRLKGFAGELTSTVDPAATSKINPVVLLPEPVAIDEAQDELSISVPKRLSNHSAEPVKASKRKRDMNDEPVDELGSDENLIGLPKECYQPRPSKRRSGGGDGEILVPTDFSKRPEAMSKGKRKAKRHKTTAFQELLPQDEDEDDEVTVVPDPRFKIPEKKQPKVSSRKAHPELEKEDNAQETQPEPQPEQNQVAKSTNPKKRGRPKKVMTDLSEEIIAEDAQVDHDQDDITAEEPVISATAREAPKSAKAKEISAPADAERRHDKDKTPAAEDDPEHLHPKILNETPGNTIPAAKSSSSSLPKTSPLKSTTTAPPETPRKSTTTTPVSKGPDKHSPLSSGQVAYRVGLSKRARIAPLLRMVRK